MMATAMAKGAEGRRMACKWLRETKVGDLVREKRRLVEVPYTASLRDTLNALIANNVVAVPVAAPPGRWIGAGGTSIVELDKATGSPRKHYIGIVTMLDVLIHIAEEEGEDVVSSPRTAAARKLSEMERRMSVQVSSVIGHSLEGLSLWTLHPNTSVMDCMEAFSKGVHRAMVPVESHAGKIVAAELDEASPGYHMLTQKDVVAFLGSHYNRLSDILATPVAEVGALNSNVYSVTTASTVLAAIKAMRPASLSSVPIVETVPGDAEGDVLAMRKGRKLVGTLSATDLRRIPVEQLQSSLNLPVMEFLDCEARERKRGLVTCTKDSTLGEVMASAAESKVHRVWVIDTQNCLAGLISLSDMLAAIRRTLLDAEQNQP